MTAKSQCLLTLLAAALAPSGPAPGDARAQESGGAFVEAIEHSRVRVVKIYGGALGMEHGYCAGVLVSDDGLLITTLSVLLESPALRVVLSDGRRFPARIVARDERRQLALLQVELKGAPFFELESSAALRPGDWLIAAANPFKVADGPEWVSISLGIFSGRGTLAARRRAQDFAYQGEVLLTDVIVASPGSAGGALVDADGRLVGVIGKAVISNRTNTWINYALPVEQARALLEEWRSGGAQPVAAALTDPPSQSIDLGILLFDIGGRGRPAFVERVRPGSPAERAGVRTGDLVLSVAGEPVATCGQYEDALAAAQSARMIPILVKRGEEMLALEAPVMVPSP